MAVILIVALLLVAGGGGAAAWFFLFNKGDSGSKETSKEKVASKDGDAMDGDAMDGDAMDGDAMDTRPTVDPRDGMDGLPSVDGMDGMDRPVTDPMDPSDAMDAMDAMDAPPASVLVLTTPRGASVTKDGKEVCLTPCPVKVPAGGSEDFVLKLRGHEAKNVTVSATGPARLTFRLHKERSGAGSARIVEPPPPMREVVIAAMRRAPDRPPPERRPAMRRVADPFSEGID
jgi:hypothetical protein